MSARFRASPSPEIMMPHVRHGAGLRRTVLCVAALGAVLLVPVRTAAQGPRTGFVFGIDVVQTSTWHVDLSPPYASRNAIGDATGIGGTAAWRITPWAALHIDYTASLYGDSDPSSFSDFGAGAEVRRQFGRFTPALSAGYGRTTAPTAGGIRFDYVDVGVAGEVLLTRRLAVRAAVRSLSPVGSAESTSSSGVRPEVRVDERRTQLRLGLRYAAGR